MKIQKERVKIWPGVEPWHVCKVLRDWLNQNKYDMSAFENMTQRDFRDTVKLHFLTEYATLALALVMHARNGVLGHVCCTRAFDDLLLLEPKLVAKSRCKFSSLELSRGLRAVMTWFREYAKKAVFRKRILKGATSVQKERKQQ